MKKYITVLIFCLVGTVASAQIETEQFDEMNLNEQFNEIKSQSETFKSYKVIKETELDAFWKSVMDSVRLKEQRIAETADVIENQEKQIAELKSTIEQKDQLLEEKEFAGTHISVLGMEFSKEGYKMFNLIIISILILAMAVLIFKYKDNSRVAKKKSNDFNRLESEFEEYKRNALEKQMKLRRDLQTATNRLEEMRSS